MRGYITKSDLAKHWDTDESTVDLDDVGCDSCNFETPKLKFYPMRSGDINEPEVNKLLCDVCASTMAGNAYEYPRQYEGERKTLQMLAYCTNLILQKIGELK